VCARQILVPPPFATALRRAQKGVSAAHGVLSTARAAALRGGVVVARMPPLHEATMKSDVARIRALLDGGAAVDGPNDVRASSQAPGRAHTAACIAGPRHQSALRGACDAGRLGAATGAAVARAASQRAHGAACALARPRALRQRCHTLPRPAMFRRCVALRASPASASCCKQHGMTPLHCAAFTGAADVVALLLDRGARVGQPDGVRPSRSRCSGLRAAHNRGC
jgi:hypothetical protein